MNLRGKTFIFIVILSLIGTLIAGMYFELISHAIDFNHPPVSVSSDSPLTGFVEKNAVDVTKMPEELNPFMLTDPLYPGSTYPPPPAPDQRMDPYLVYPLTAP